MVNLLLDFLFPPRCVGCGRLGEYICPKCRLTMVLREARCPECDRPAIDGATHPGCLRPWGLGGLTTVFRYEGVLKKTIKQLKYRFVYDEAEILVKLIPEAVFTHALFHQSSSSKVIYPIPLHPDRLKWRGFNQAEKLARVLSKRLGLPLVKELLVRKAKRMPQADIQKREARIKNAQGIFALETRNLPPQIVLFDDVWTTGATMKEAAKVLKRGGVEKVWGVTIAR